MPDPLTLSAARRMLDAALVHAHARQLHGLGIVVLDAGGHLRASVRDDAAGFAALDIASAKARGALAFGMDSRQVADVFGGNPALCASLGSTLKGDMLPLAGAVLLRDSEGRVRGAIAAAGSAPDDDEDVARAGRDAADDAQACAS